MTAAPFTAVIVDDEPLAIEGVRRFCERSGLVRIVGEAVDGPAGLDLIAKTQPQVVFLDIAMPGLSGLKVAAAARDLSAPPKVVFVTAHDHFATEAFDLAVVDYILKPIVPERIGRTLERLNALLEQDAAIATAPLDFWVPYRGSVLRLAADRIERIEAERDYVRIFSEGRSYLLRATLGDMESRLASQQFLRIHRSTIIDPTRIKAMRHVGAGAWVVIDADDSERPVGRNYLAQVRDRLGL